MNLKEFQEGGEGREEKTDVIINSKNNRKHLER